MSKELRSGADIWQKLSDEFEVLAKEEQAEAGPLLMATVDPSSRPLDEVNRWRLQTATSDRLRERFARVGEDAARALGRPPGDASELNFWLHCLHQNVVGRATGVRSLIMASEKSSCIRIEKICEESVTFCVSLQRHTLSIQSNKRTLAEWFSRWIDDNSSAAVPFYPSTPSSVQSWIVQVAKRADNPIPIHFLSSRLKVHRKLLIPAKGRSLRIFFEKVATKYKLTWCITRWGLWIAKHPPENEEYIDASGIHQIDLIADYKVSAGSDSNPSNREIVDDYIDKVFTICKVRISRADIIRAAAYENRREFERWQKGEHKPGSKAHRRFTKVLSLDPHEFLDQLKIIEASSHKLSR